MVGNNNNKRNKPYSVGSRIYEYNHVVKRISKTAERCDAKRIIRRALAEM